MDAISAALSGLNAAESRLDQTAKRLSQIGVVNNVPTDSVDLASEMVNLMTAKLQFEANLKSLETGNEMAKHTIDILG
jgi:flagellar basal body rod protein FlgC